MIRARVARTILHHGWIAICLAVAGCTMPNGSPVSLSAANRLSSEAAEFRRMAPSPQPLPSELEQVQLVEYIVEPGDVLRAEMAEPDAMILLPPDQVVMIDGKIDLGAFGRIHVAGRSLEEVQGIVQAAVRKRAPDAREVIVRLVTTDSKTFFVLGAVNSPGEYPLTGRENVLNAIVRAGGPSNSADVDRIILSRPSKPCDGRQVLPICYDDIVQLGDTSTNYQLQPGDRVFVPSRSIWKTMFPFGGHKRCDPCDVPQYPAPAERLYCPVGAACPTPHSAE